MGLFIAAGVGAEEIVDLLLARRDCDVNRPLQSDLMTPLHEAARCGRTSVVQRLLAAGAKTNAATVFGCTALHLACRAARTDVAAALLAAAAEPNAVNENGQTPMGLAFEASQRSREGRAAFKSLCG